jgi:hypothetical protein
MEVDLNQINNMIYIIRGQKVMIGSDFGKIYEAGTNALTSGTEKHS